LKSNAPPTPAFIQSSVQKNYWLIPQSLQCKNWLTWIFHPNEHW
jgi:hypothetical protein